jgi:hypothetical protein
VAQHSPDLDLHYDFDGFNLRFEDGVSYTLSEAVILAKGRPTRDDVRAVHALKKAFDGVLLPHTQEAGANLALVYTGPEPLSALLKRLNEVRPGDFGGESKEGRKSAKEAGGNLYRTPRPQDASSAPVGVNASRSSRRRSPAAASQYPPDSTPLTLFPHGLR